MAPVPTYVQGTDLVAAGWQRQHSMWQLLWQLTLQLCQQSTWNAIHDSHDLCLIRMQCSILECAHGSRLLMGLQLR